MLFVVPSYTGPPPRRAPCRAACRLPIPVIIIPGGACWWCSYLPGISSCHAVVWSPSCRVVHLFWWSSMLFFLPPALQVFVVFVHGGRPDLCNSVHAWCCSYYLFVLLLSFAACLPAAPAGRANSWWSGVPAMIFHHHAAAHGVQLSMVLPPSIQRPTTWISWCSCCHAHCRLHLYFSLLCRRVPVRHYLVVLAAVVLFSCRSSFPPACVPVPPAHYTDLLPYFCSW